MRREGITAVYDRASFGPEGVRAHEQSGPDRSCSLVSCVAWVEVATIAVFPFDAIARTAATSRHLATFVETHCVACHNDRALTGGLSLSADTFASLSGKTETWEKVLHKIRTGQMPPANRPRPSAADINAVTTWLQTTLDTAADRDPQPGRVGAHRLNRTEYANAIRDLLSLQIDAAALLLPDEAEDGFDNVAASLALSPSHLERYLAAARQISRMAVGDRSAETVGDVAGVSGASAVGTGRAS